MGDAFPSLGALTELASEQKPLMDAIDELRRYQIDKIVDLPQIIVIGDQSSGKSSVLAAISKIQFPAKGSVCTRFAIELVLRTSSRSTLGAHIHRTNGSITELRAVADTNFDGGLLANIIEDAGKKMRTLSGFSEDVLRVEICRPDVPHLTLIDLPGFYHSENEEQSAEGRLLVERLADKYMARDTSIILAIVAASNDVILQSVLSKVRQHDKGGRRTLGIVTKPDLLLAGSRGEMMVQLARNTQPSHKLELGWHVLRNRDENEIDDLDDTRDEKESELLSRAPWNTLRSADRGVARLRTKLSNILLRHIQQSLPDLDANIRGKLDEYEARLKSLGEPRARPADLRAFLDRVASRYQTICSHALEGNYSDDFFGGLYPDDEQDERTRKLRALVRDLNRAFAYILGRKGARRRVVHPDDPTGPADSDNASEASYASSSGESTDSTTEAPAFIGGWEIHATGEIQRLTQAYNFADPEVIPVSRMARELDLLASRNQGNELPGTSNDALALNLFRDQISPWAKIADFHVQHVTWFAKAFVEKLMSHIIADDDEAPYRAILQHRVDPFFEARAVELKAKVRELLFHYQHGHPQPYDAEFQTLFTDARRPQTTNAAIAVLKDMPWLLSEEGKSVLATASQAASKTKANKQPNPASLDVIAKCQTYYQISIYSFINNVIILAVENCLIRKLPSVMTTEMVSQMEDEELCLLASESSSAQLDRAELQRTTRP
ncbi:vacuolar protein sorting-associated protein 1 [Microdochium nivale]|nr:vacuolar protein sorting-associated protein 1 [Microdochium nivale]